jgi:septal ring factor EnvC (AmiA/AmiB activator)
MTNHDSESQKQPSGRARTDTNQQDINSKSGRTLGVTLTAVSELHRRVLAADDAISDAERQLTVIADLSGQGEDQSDNLLAELQALHQRLEETQNRLHRSLDGVDELLEVARKEPACEDTSPSDTPDADTDIDTDTDDQGDAASLFDEEYIRNREQTASELQEQ